MLKEIKTRIGENIAPPPPYNPVIPEFELISNIIVIFVSLFIFFKTKEIYELTNHKGVDFFRKAFLFFGLNSFLNIFQILLRANYITFIPQTKLLFLISAFLSFVGILYLFASIFLRKSNMEFLMYIIPLLVIGVMFLTHQRWVFLVLQISALLAMMWASFVIYKKQKHKKFFSKTYMIYLSIFLFWILNIVRFELEVFFDIGREIISIFSALIFLYILYVFLRRFLSYTHKEGIT